MSIKTLSNSPLEARVRLSQTRGVPNPAGNFAEASRQTKRLQINVQKPTSICFLLVISYSQLSLQPAGMSPMYCTCIQ